MRRVNHRENRRVNQHAAWIGMLTALLALGACAHGTNASERQAIAFPDDFSLIQVVAVEQGETRMDFFASLSRQGDDLTLAMLDPVLQRPIYEAHTSGGEFTETRPLPEEARGLGAMLFDALRQLFTATELDRADDVLRFEGDRFLFELTPWDPNAACPFPSEIRMRARRGGPQMRVVARTEDVACERASE